MCDLSGSETAVVQTKDDDVGTVKSRNMKVKRIERCLETEHSGKML
jgi:hypothetical protein